MGRRRQEEISRKVLYGGLCGYGGHRIGTYEIESALVEHEKVAESAVVSLTDEIKGEL
jgi:non-ribosomal peptide synthetase component E (peptide arylation enzyme)